MKKIIFLIGFIVINIKIANACFDSDGKYRLVIENLKNDHSKLIAICEKQKEACLSFSYSRERIIRSKYDELVSLQIVDDSIVVRLPYDIKKGVGIEKDKLLKTTHDPNVFNWKEEIKVDLIFLKKLGVVTLDNDEIQQIIDLAEGGVHLDSSGNSWRLLRFRGCGGDLSKISLPKNQLQ